MNLACGNTKKIFFFISAVVLLVIKVMQTIFKQQIDAKKKYGFSKTNSKVTLHFVQLQVIVI